MPLGAYMLTSVVRIVGDVEYRVQGKAKWTRGHLGTGFCVRVADETHPTGWQGYVVTAHHVVDAQPKPELVFPNTTHPGQLYPPVATDGPDWQQPLEDVDIALYPFSPPAGQVLTALQVDYHLYAHIPSGVMLAMPFHYVGLLEPLNRAMARSGTLGAVYQSGIKHPDGYSYLAHLGDARTYDGFSGSPCFVEFSYPSLVEKELPFPLDEGEEQVPMGRIRYMHLLCGMITYHLERALEGREASAFGVVCMVTSDDIGRAVMAAQSNKASGG
jgi:hypothetical protein